MTKRTHIHRLVLGSVSWWVAFSILGGWSGSASGEVLVFEGARVIVGDGKTIVEEAAFVVEDGTLTRVGPSGEVAVPEGAIRTDLSGKTVMPMLVNLHGHVGYFSFDDLSFEAENYTRANILEQLERHEYYGVGAVVSQGTDVGDVAFRVRADQRAGKLGGATLFLAGRGFAAPGGGPPITPLQHAPYEVDQPPLARLLVRELAARAVDMIKIWVDDRSGTVPKLEPAVYRAVIDEAHRHSLKVIAHVFYLSDAKKLVRAGVDGFAHLVRDREVDDELVEMMKAKDVFVCPVLNTHAVALEDDPLGWRHDPAVAETVRAEVLELLPSRQPHWGGSGGSESRRRIYPRMQASIRKLVAAGVRIALGVDAGIPNHFAGFNEHQELQYLVDSGLTPLAAIAAATSTSAAILGLDDRGTLAPGKRADFIVLDENPLENIVYTRRIADVYRGGHAIDRDARRRAWH